MRWASFKACIFDFDGVLVDSEPLHARAKRLTLEANSVPFEESVFDQFKGRTDRDFFAHFAAQDARLNLEALLEQKRAAYTELFAEVAPIPGALEFVEAARAHQQRLGVATSATRFDFGLADRRYGLSARFDAIVTGDETRAHKPDPEPYLQALSRLGVSAEAALVIEDAPNGIIAAKRAGCTVAGITTGFDEATLLEAGADVVVASFADLETLLSSSP